MQYRIYNGELYHYGILGMKWGVRRYQNSNGSLTNAGKNRYSKAESRSQKDLAKAQKKWDKKAKRVYVKAYNSTADYVNKHLVQKFNDEYVAKYKDKYGIDWTERATQDELNAYYDDYQQRFNAILNQKIVDLIGSRPE